MISANALHWNHVAWPIAGGFRIARGEKHFADVIEVHLQDTSGHVGRGECVPYSRYGESLESVGAQITALQEAHSCFGFDEIAQMPPGAARNAMDCAMWDLWAQASGISVRANLGLLKFAPCTTAYTLSLDTPAAMAAKAAKYADRPLLKLKLAGDGHDPARLAAIHDARPDASLILDGNEGFTPATLAAFLPQLDGLQIAALEQPLPAGQDEALSDVQLPFPVCADESVHVADDLRALVGKYSMVNVKLDKTGGLTEAVKVVRQARLNDLRVMVGCMVGSSLAMAPALTLSTQADLIDLDGPLLLERDHDHGMQFDGSRIVSDAPKLWGYPRAPG